MNDSMIFYRSFYEAINNLSGDMQAEIYDAIFSYGLDGIEKELEGVAKAIFALVKPQIDANNKRRERGRENGKKGAEFGKMGGRPAKEVENPQKTPNKPPENPQQTPNKPSNVNVNDNVNVNVNVKRFTPPSVDDVREYCLERKNNVDAERFVDFYASKGWKVGNQAMKDWKACVRTWEKRDSGVKQKTVPFIQGSLEDDLDEIEKLTRRRAT